MAASINEEDDLSPQYEAWLQQREVAEYLTWWRKEQALEDVRDAAADKPVWKV
jgi:hypothetical protein